MSNTWYSLFQIAYLENENNIPSTNVISITQIHSRPLGRWWFKLRGSIEYMNCGHKVNILKKNALRVISSLFPSAQALQSAVDSGFQYNSPFLPVPGYCMSIYYSQYPQILLIIKVTVGKGQKSQV